MQKYKVKNEFSREARELSKEDAKVIPSYVNHI